MTVNISNVDNTSANNLTGADICKSNVNDRIYCGLSDENCGICGMFWVTLGITSDTSSCVHEMIMIYSR